jgi:hypothetical protein
VIARIQAFNQTPERSARARRPNGTRHFVDRNRFTFALRVNLLRLFDNSVLRQYVIYWADLALTRFGLDGRLIHSAFERDGRIAVLEDEGRIVAVNFYWIDQISDGVLTIDFPVDAVLASDGFVDPAFRGSRYLAAIKAFAAREFVASGYRGMVSFSRWRNVSSKRAHRHARARPLFRIVILRGPFGIRLTKERNTLSLGRRSTIVIR